MICLDGMSEEKDPKPHRLLTAKGTLMKFKCKTDQKKALLGKLVKIDGVTKDKVYDGAIVVNNGQTSLIIYNDDQKWEALDLEYFEPAYDRYF